MEKAKKYFPYVYIIFLVFSFFYVRSVMKEGDLRDYDETVDKAIKEVAVDVILVVGNESYSVKLESRDTVLDLLEDLRGDDKFHYEKTDYTYGTELDSVNGVKPSPGYKWKVFRGNEDITHTIGDIYLTDDTTYTIRLEKE